MGWRCGYAIILEWIRSYAHVSREKTSSRLLRSTDAIERHVAFSRRKRFFCTTSVSRLRKVFPTRTHPFSSSRGCACHERDVSGNEKPCVARVDRCLGRASTLTCVRLGHVSGRKRARGESSRRNLVEIVLKSFVSLCTHRLGRTLEASLVFGGRIRRNEGRARCGVDESAS